MKKMNLIHYFNYERIHYNFHRPDGMGDDQRKNREMKYYKITGPDNRQTGITEHELAEIMQRVIELDGITGFVTTEITEKEYAAALIAKCERKDRNDNAIRLHVASKLGILKASLYNSLYFQKDKAFRKLINQYL
jgi:hypothetical protein